ncbi:MAG: TolB family protein [Blastocatellia bacterium]
MNWIRKLTSVRRNLRGAQTAQGPREEASPFNEGRANAKGMFACIGTYRGAKGLYLVDGSGSVAAELARPGVDERLGHFAVSPDARWVAYTCFVRRRTDRDYYPIIRAVNVRGGTSRDLTEWDPGYETCYQNPVFSPTGEEIVCEFALGHPYNPDLKVLRLFDIGNGLVSSGRLCIVNQLGIGNHAPQFMPDGKRIVYFGNFAYEDLLEVCLYDPAISESDVLGAVGWRLTEKADGVWHRPRAIAVQPEWEQIFFIQGHTRNAERICVIVPADLSPGTHVKKLESCSGEHQRISALEMSRDGLKLAYEGDGIIYVVGTDGSIPRRITTEGLNCRCPRFSEDGSRLAFVLDQKLCMFSMDDNGSEIFTGDELRIDEFIWA